MENYNKPADETRRLVVQYQQQPCQCNRNENLQPASETCKCQGVRITQMNHLKIP